MIIKKSNVAFRLKINRRKLNELEEKYNTDRKALLKDREDIEKECDHKHPNGKSALIDSCGYLMCSICSWSDM